MTNQITISEAAYCAHIHVRYERIHYPQGTCSDSWVCKDCGLNFVPLTPTLAEREREIAELRELRTVTLERYLTNHQKRIVEERNQLRAQLDAAREAIGSIINDTTKYPQLSVNEQIERRLERIYNQLTKENK